MEFSEFFKLLKKYLKTFLVILIGIILIGFFWYRWQISLYRASIAVNISRDQETEKQDYQYDQFYRLQADEKFGKNIVNWVGDPGLRNLVQEEFSKNKKMSWSDISRIKATQFSSNYVKIEFKSKNSRSALAFGQILGDNLKNKNQQLNSNQGKNWFKLVVDEVYVTKNEINLVVFSGIIFCLAILFGLLGVLVGNYFNSKNENRN